MRIDGGVVVVRSSTPDDVPALVAGRDAEFHRWLGPGSAEPSPTACIEVDHEVIGWVDYDADDREWLGPGEVNIGYHVFADSRGHGYARRAVRLLLHHLALTREADTATALIERDNRASLAVAAASGFVRRRAIGTNVLLARPIPALSYTQADTTIRRRVLEDLNADLAGKDDEQQRWLWTANERAQWATMDSPARRTHSLTHLTHCRDTFGRGPKWTFSVDVGASRAVGYADCDLANEHVPTGDANISYSVHPDHRGRGIATRAAALAHRFAMDHTGAQRSWFVIHADNTRSLRVATALGAREIDSVHNGGHRFRRFLLEA